MKGNWDQDRFEDLLEKWIIAMDQPFYTVNNPKFHSLLTYTHHLLPTLEIQYHNAVKRWIMKMGDNTIEAIKHMFKVHKYLPFLCTQTYNPVNSPGKC